MTSAITTERLYAVAAELFAEHGYETTSVRMIAKALDIKAGSLYYHMDSKDDLLFNVINTALDKLIEPVRRIAASSLSPAERLRQALTTHIALGCATRNEMIVTAREAGKLTPQRAAFIRQKRLEYEQMFQSFIASGMDSGELRRFDVKITSYAAIAMANWICQLYRPSGALSLEEISRIYVEIFFGGLSADMACVGSNNTE